jgi:hypothetical protein
VALGLLGLLCACTTLNVSVKPPTFNPEEYARSARNGLELRAIPIEGVVRYWEMFDDYLPEIGIAAVWAVVRNTGDSEINLSRTKWVLRYGGRIHPALRTDQAFKLYYKRRNIRLYSLNADMEARTRLAGKSHHRSILQPQTEQAGFLLFDVSPSPDPEWGQGAILMLQDIQFTKDERTDLILPLTHANTNR